MKLEWIACEARTGRVLAELPELKPTGPLKRTLGRSDSLAFTLPWSTAPMEWKRATKPGAVFLVALAGGKPVFGCLVLRRVEGWGSDPSASLMGLDGVTVEGYFERRYVGSVDLLDVGQNTVVDELITRYVRDGAAGLPGIPLRVDTGGVAGPLIRRTYRDASDKTITSCLTELSSTLGGPEWTVEWEFTAGARPTYTPVLQVGARIGTDPRRLPLPLAPVTFDIPGCARSAELVESYEAGKGGTRVTATGPKLGDVRQQLTLPASAADPDMPTFELRGSVSTDTDATPAEVTETLRQHAAAAIALTAPGQRALTLVAEVESAPRLGDGQDGTWRLGDTIRADLATRLPKNPTAADRARQRVFRGEYRCIGWEWDTTAAVETVTPILLVPEADL